MSQKLNGFTLSDLDDALNHADTSLRSLNHARVFITGGTGFIGQWLVALLGYAAQNIPLDLQLVLLTRNAARFRALAPELAALPCVTLIEGDIRNYPAPPGQFTHVIHGATDTSAAADSEPETLRQSIVAGTHRTLDFAIAAGAKRFLYLSSGAAYGPQPASAETIAEDHSGAPDRSDPRMAYGCAKRDAEHLCFDAAQSCAIETVVARAFAFVGPGLPLDGHFAIGNFIADAIAGRSIVIGGNGTPLRSYLYASDLAAWLITLLVKGRAGEAYNVGSDHAISIADLARSVALLIPGAGAVDMRGRADPHAHRTRYIPSIAKAQAHCGLSVWTNLDESILRTALHARRANGLKP